MSAPSIPNLNSLRRGGFRPRGPGRGRGGIPAQSDHLTASSGGIVNPPAQAAIQDRIIRATDNDAATSRLSAVAAGYLDDPFAALLLADSQPPRRLPLMNRGTYVRTTAVDRMVDTFLASHEGQQTQIISLGAGSDARYFRLHRKYRDKPMDLVYHEFDLAENVKAKISRIQRPEFIAAIKKETDLHWPNPLPAADPSAADPQFSQGTYTLSTLDLRTLSNPTSSSSTSFINATTPTLLVSECCLCYLPPKLATAALHYFTRSVFPTSTPLSCVIYEPTRPFDAFGRTMTSNLASRGISLPTLEKWPDPVAQRGRLKDAGFHEEGGGAEAADLEFIWRNWVAEEEMERVERLEWMDEVEEFVLLGRHYVVVWGWRGYGNGDGDERWRGLPSQRDGGEIGKGGRGPG